MLQLSGPVRKTYGFNAGLAVPPALKAPTSEVAEFLSGHDPEIGPGPN